MDTPEITTVHLSVGLLKSLHSKGPVHPPHPDLCLVQGKYPKSGSVVNPQNTRDMYTAPLTNLLNHGCTRTFHTHLMNSTMVLLSILVLDHVIFLTRTLHPVTINDCLISRVVSKYQYNLTWIMNRS